MPSPADVVAFWRAAGPERWFEKDAGFDDDIRRRFLKLHEAAARRQTHRLGSKRGGRAGAAHPARSIPAQHVPRASRAPSPAIRWRAPIASRAILNGFDGAFPDLRGFFYLPFEHSEDLADQERAFAFYKRARRRRRPEMGGAARRHHPPLRPLPASQRGARPRQHAGGTEVPRRAAALPAEREKYRGTLPNAFVRLGANEQAGHREPRLVPGRRPCCIAARALRRLMTIAGRSFAGADGSDKTLRATRRECRRRRSSAAW